MSFFRAYAGALFNSTVNGLAVDAFLFRFFDRGKKAGVHAGVGAAHFGGDGDFAHKFGGGAALFEAGDQSFGMEPLSSHAGRLAESHRRIKPRFPCRRRRCDFHIGVFQELAQQLSLSHCLRWEITIAEWPMPANSLKYFPPRHGIKNLPRFGQKRAQESAPPCKNRIGQRTLAA